MCVSGDSFDKDDPDSEFHYYAGHVDPGESDWETALRETKEEAGLSVNDLEVSIYKHHVIILYL